MEMLYIGR